MAKRYSMRRRDSKRIFRKTADLTHVRNFAGSPMRGGIRL